MSSTRPAAKSDPTETHIHVHVHGTGSGHADGKKKKKEKDREGFFHTAIGKVRDAFKIRTDVGATEAPAEGAVAAEGERGNPSRRGSGSRSSSPSAEDQKQWRTRRYSMGAERTARFLPVPGGDDDEEPPSPSPESSSPPLRDVVFEEMRRSPGRSLSPGAESRRWLSRIDDFNEVQLTKTDCSTAASLAARQRRPGGPTTIDGILFPAYTFADEEHWRSVPWVQFCSTVPPVQPRIRTDFRGIVHRASAQGMPLDYIVWDGYDVGYYLEGVYVGTTAEVLGMTAQDIRDVRAAEKLSCERHHPRRSRCTRAISPEDTASIVGWLRREGAEIEAAVFGAVEADAVGDDCVGAEEAASAPIGTSIAAEPSVAAAAAPIAAPIAAPAAAEAQISAPVADQQSGAVGSSMDGNLYVPMITPNGTGYFIAQGAIDFRGLPYALADIVGTTLRAGIPHGMRILERPIPGSYPMKLRKVPLASSSPADATGRSKPQPVRATSPLRQQVLPAPAPAAAPETLYPVLQALPAVVEKAAAAAILAPLAVAEWAMRPESFGGYEDDGEYDDLLPPQRGAEAVSMSFRVGLTPPVPAAMLPPAKDPYLYDPAPPPDRAAHPRSPSLPSPRPWIYGAEGSFAPLDAEAYEGSDVEGDEADVGNGIDAPMMPTSMVD